MDAQQFENSVKNFTHSLVSQRDSPQTVSLLANQIANFITEDSQAWLHLLRIVIDRIEAQILLSESDASPIEYAEKLYELTDQTLHILQEKLDERKNSRNE